jgi:hypothetical protein
MLSVPTQSLPVCILGLITGGGPLVGGGVTVGASAVRAADRSNGVSEGIGAEIDAVCVAHAASESAASKMSVIIVGVFIGDPFQFGLQSKLPPQNSTPLQHRQ